MPGQISIVGFSRFISESYAEHPWRRQIFCARNFLSLAICHKSLARSGHENIYLINLNHVRNTDRASVICTKPRRITGCRHFPGCRKCYGRPAESAGDDEADDRVVETERKSQVAREHGRQLELYDQILDESRSKRATAAIQRQCHAQKHHGWSLLCHGRDWKNADVGRRRQTEGYAIQRYGH